MTFDPEQPRDDHGKWAGGDGTLETKPSNGGQFFQLKSDVMDVYGHIRAGTPPEIQGVFYKGAREGAPPELQGRGIATAEVVKTLTALRRAGHDEVVFTDLTPDGKKFVNGLVSLGALVPNGVRAPRSRVDVHQPKFRIAASSPVRLSSKPIKKL